MQPDELQALSRSLGTSAHQEAVSPVDSSDADEQLRELFELGRCEYRTTADGKLFADRIPRASQASILAEFQRQRTEPDFDLRTFFETHFVAAPPSASLLHSEDSLPQYLNKQWGFLTRYTPKKQGSLLPLPYPYIVPGGRFQEQFYWDGYFIMLGLEASGRHDLVSCMMKNYLYMIDTYGYIPTANRTYFLSRSQPPFFSHMVRLLLKHRGRADYARYLPYLLKEYRFWMYGENEVARHPFSATKRVVALEDGLLLNRYYDHEKTARPESFFEDTQTAKQATQPHDELFTHLRAAAESGWDFSSRWLRAGHQLASIQTTDILPIDLNCLLYDTELLLSKVYHYTRQQAEADQFMHRAERRKQAIMTYCWHEKDGFLYDFNFTDRRISPKKTLAASFGLFSGVVSSERAERITQVLREGFLQPGGLVTTLESSGQQWDSPNGWAPLQWIAYVGCRRYHQNELAETIRQRWVGTVTDFFQQHHCVVEKYHTRHPLRRAGGGEYEVQDGFGWTNGVILAMLEGAQ